MRWDCLLRFPGMLPKGDLRSALSFVQHRRDGGAAHCRATARAGRRAHGVSLDDGAAARAFPPCHCRPAGSPSGRTALLSTIEVRARRRYTTHRPDNLARSGVPGMRRSCRRSDSLLLRDPGGTPCLAASTRASTGRRTTRGHAVALSSRREVPVGVQRHSATAKSPRGAQQTP